MLQNISIAAPAYNEGEGIRRVVEAWTRHLQQHFSPEKFEIILCDDGSRDDTWSILSDLARLNPSIKPCQHGVNQGAAAALTTAIARTTKDWVLLLDSDGQYPIENLDRFLEAMERQPAPAFIGYRTEKADSAFARFGSRASGACCNFFHGTHYRDFNCALKLVHGNLLRDLVLEAKGLNYSTEITSRILERHAPIIEVEALHEPRREGRSSRTPFRSTLHRALFVAYIGLRQFLLRRGVLQRRLFSPL